MMQHKMSAASVTGIAMTVAAGAAAAYVMGGRTEAARRRAVKRTAARAARAVGTAVGGVVDNVAGRLR